MIEIKVLTRSWSWHLQPTEALELWRDGHPVLTIRGDLLGRILAYYYLGAQLARVLGEPPPEERLPVPEPPPMPEPGATPDTPRARWQAARARTKRRPAS